jgi:hypothetical protein
MTDRQAGHDSLHGFYIAIFYSSEFFHLWRHLNPFVCAAPVGDEEAFHGIADACQTILSQFGTSYP